MELGLKYGNNSKQWDGMNDGVRPRGRLDFSFVRKRTKACCNLYKNATNPQYCQGIVMPLYYKLRISVKILKTYLFSIWFVLKLL